MEPTLNQKTVRDDQKEKNDKDPAGNTIQTQTKFIYKVQEQELKKVELEPNLMMRLIKGESNMYVDIRRFYKNYPTKKGIRISLELFNAAHNLINN